MLRINPVLILTKA